MKQSLIICKCIFLFYYLIFIVKPLQHEQRAVGKVAVDQWQPHTAAEIVSRETVSHNALKREALSNSQHKESSFRMINA